MSYVSRWAARVFVNSDDACRHGRKVGVNESETPSGFSLHKSIVVRKEKNIILVEIAEYKQ